MIHQPAPPDTFNRPPRIRPQWRTETVELPEPPVPSAQFDRINWWMLVLPLLSAAALVGAMVMINQGGNALLFGVPMAVMAGMGVIGTLLSSRSRRKQSADEFAQRQAFFEQRLRDTQAQVHALYDDERRIRRELQPDGETLLRIAGALGTSTLPQARLWERRIGDPDFLELSIGYGRVPFSTTITKPSPRSDSPLDPRIFALAQRYRMLDSVPVTLLLPEVGSVGIAGSRAEALALLRVLIWQMAVFHAPTEVRMAVMVPGDAARDWEVNGDPWVCWLPHTVPLNNDPDFGARMYAREDEAVKHLMSDLLDELNRRRDLHAQHHQRDTASVPHFTPLLVVVDGVERVRDQPLLSEIMRSGPHYNMLALFCVPHWEEIPNECGMMVDLQPGAARRARNGAPWSHEPCSVHAAAVDLGTSDVLAHRLAPLKVAEMGSNQDLPRNVRLFDLLNIADEHDLQPPAFWRTPPERAWHSNVPIGAKAGGQPLYLDLYEQMHGPHGIIAGATGAGKSVLLQGIIAALAITHSPKQLQLLLIDFKGGASLAQLAQLPHAAGFVTDLEGRLTERAMTAIKSELRYRKTLFRDAEKKIGSKVENISEYREKAHADLPPLPNLLIVIDEFDEMVQGYKAFVAELVRVVKQGRSLGVHLLVASQQPAKAVTDDIRTQLKFFVALRLGSSEDSREMLGTSDAAFLPTDIPGRAYFRVGADVMPFQVAQIVGAYRSTQAAVEAEDDVVFHRPGRARIISPANTPAKDRQKTTDLDVLIRALRTAGADLFRQERQQTGWQPRPIWQPPLPAQLTLGKVRPHEARQVGQAVAHARQQPVQHDEWLLPALGCLDIPQESRQEPLRMPLRKGHLAVIGASGSGKTMLLRTLLLDLALTYAPHELWCYVIDAGGHSLSPLADLPHVGGLIQARDREHVRRLLTMITRELRRRQELFRQTGAPDLPAYRQLSGTGHTTPLPAWVIVIDKLALLREEFKDKHGYDTVTEDLIRLVRVGHTYGVHFVITAESTRDMTYQLLSLCDLRIALRLPDLHDYTDVLGQRVASQIGATVPGRGLWMHPDLGILDLQVALPLLEQPHASANEEDAQAAMLESELNDNLKTTVQEICAAWTFAPATAPQPKPIELLPEHLWVQQLGASSFHRRPLAAELEVPLGKESVDLEVAHLRLDQDMPHALVLGGRRSGKTTALQSLLVGLARCYTADQIRLLIIAPRRGLRALRGLPHTACYAETEDDVQQVVERLQQVVNHADAGPHGRWIVAVDDYDLGYRQMERQFRSVFDHPNLFSVLKRVAVEGDAHEIHLLLAANIKFPEEAGEVIKTLEAARHGLILWPHKYDGGTRLLDVALPVGDRNADLPPGRALLVREESSALVQVAAVPQGEVDQVVARMTHGKTPIGDTNGHAPEVASYAATIDDRL